jgi:hypothetical protein
MQHLNTLWQLVNAASTVSELARHSQTYRFGVMEPITVYLRAENAVVQVSRWQQPMVEVSAQLQAAFGWRIVTDQDEAGVYFVAKRRVVVGGLSRAVFRVNVPRDTYLILKLRSGHVLLEDVEGTLNIAPPDNAGQMEISPSPVPRLEAVGATSQRR